MFIVYQTVHTFHCRSNPAVSCRPRLRFRVVHGSLFLDPTRPGKTLTRPDPTRPVIADEKSDSTPLPPPPICTMFHEFNIQVANREHYAFQV